MHTPSDTDLSWTKSKIKLGIASQECIEALPFKMEYTSDLTEVLSIFSGVDSFSQGCFSAGFTFNLLFIRLSILDLSVAGDSLAEAKTVSAQLGCMLTHITGQLAGLLWNPVSRCEMCRKTAFTSLTLIFFCVAILEREKHWYRCLKISSFNQIKSILWSLHC